MDELISRRAAIDATWEEPTYNDPLNVLAEVRDRLKALPSAQPDLDEWCTDCKEYNQEKHCCPRWNRVIRETAEELRQNAEPRWIPVTEDNKPPICSNALVTDFNSVLEAYYDSKGNWWDLLGTPLKWVTAWMPLPKPYERSEDGEM